MKTQTIFVLLFLGNILLQPIMAQTNRVTTTRTTGTTVENGVTMMVTQETTTVTGEQLHKEYRMQSWAILPAKHPWIWHYHLPKR